MTQPTSGSSSQGLNLLLACLALVWLGWITALFIQDIQVTHRRNTAQDPSLANARAIQAVKDTTGGWFPGQRDPIFSFDEDEQGWMLEEDNPAAFAPGADVAAGDEKTEEKEAAEPPVNPAKKLHVADAPKVSYETTDRGKALAIPVQFPDPVTVFRDSATSKSTIKLQGVRFLSYDVFVPKECSGFIGCLLFFKDKDGLWYQARSRTSLVPGRWTTVAADIRGESPDVTPLGHLGQWDENQATRVRTVGITLYGDKPYTGTLLVDNFRGWLRPQRFEQMLSQLNGATSEPVAPERASYLQLLAEQAAVHKEPAIRILNLRTDPPPPPADPATKQSSPPLVRKFETLTVRFELNRQVDNPFDPEKADVTCLVETPGGNRIEHIGFWYQDYDRTDRFAGDELIPLGRPEWRVRITPCEEGEHKYTLKVRLRNSTSAMYEELAAPARSFFCMPSNERGFVQVSRKDPRYFEFDNGEFFYPIGHNLHSPIDIRCWKEVFKEEPPADRGLPMYADFFPRMQQSGDNTAEVWMASWWLGIEWTSRWRDYYGAGRYSLQHAWKLDHLLEMARKHGIYIHLVLDNHGKFSSWCDWEWDLNPYNSNCDSSGVITHAREFFSNETAKKWHRNKLRYIAARWGADTTVLGWELVSEYDLVGGTHRHDQAARHNFHRSATLQAWARDMITYLRKCDAYDHPVTNHYATDYNWIDLKLARMTVEPEIGTRRPLVKQEDEDINPDKGAGTQPLLDYVVTDAYRPDKGYQGIAMRTQGWAQNNLHRLGAKKPFWITEFGGDWNATSPAALEADVHCGMWATWMTDGAGTPLFWWYDFIHRNNLYTYYKAFANYTRGEDRRGIKGATIPLAMTAGNNSFTLRGNAYRWNTGAYAWVFNVSAMENMPAPSGRMKYEGVQSAITELDAGAYRIEYWDCYEGVIVESERQQLASGQMLQLKFPPFTNNMAVKVKREK